MESGSTACHGYMSFFGANRCFASGFTRLFCPIEESVSTDEGLRLSPYVQEANRVEHLTVALTGGRQVDMVLSNRQLAPAERAKVLLLQGHLSVTDVNQHLFIRVEYGWNCKDYSLTVPAGISTTRYRRFDGEDGAIYEGNNVVTLPSCFKVIPNGSALAGAAAREVSSARVADQNQNAESDEDVPLPIDPEILVDTDVVDAPIAQKPGFFARSWNVLQQDNSK